MSASTTTSMTASLTRAARACGALAAIAFALLASGCGETEDVEVEVGFRGEALRNPFLAAERVLGELGRETRAIDRLVVPSASDAVLFVGAEHLAFEGPDLEAVRAWVVDGGHLVLPVFGNDRPMFPDWRDLEAHPLLEPLGIAPSGEPRTRDDSLAGDFENWEVDAHRTLRGRGEYRGAQLRSAEGGVLVLDADPAVQPVARLVGGQQLHGAAYEVGRGRVVVLANASFASNHLIGDERNASFLWTLVEAAPSGAVVFVLTPDATLLSLLWSRARALVIGGTALVLVWLWMLTRRFGPLVASPGRRRLAFGDHVQASGRFLWRYVGAHALVEPLRRRVLRAAERRVLDTGRRERLVAALAERSRLEPKRVETALFGPLTDESDSLVAIVRDLHQLERAHD